MDNNLGLLLAKRAFLNPGREAYVDGHSGARFTFAALDARANQVANAFRAAGVGKGDRVAFLLMNSVEFMEAFFGLAKIGAVVVPLNWRLVPDELEFILKDSGASHLVFDNDFVDCVAELHARGEKTDVRQWLQVSDSEPAHFATSYGAFRAAAPAAAPATEGRDDDMLYIMYTSGTTGLPKGVVHTHGTCIWSVLTMAGTAEMRDGDRYLACLPMFHVGALAPLTLNVYRGVTSIVMRAFDPARAWQLIEDERITTGLCVPAMLNFMLQVPTRNAVDHSLVRWIMCGAAPVPDALVRAYAELGIEVHQVYGLTETCGPACLITGEDALERIGSTGKAFFHTEVRIVDENGQACPPDVAGEVLVRGRHIMREYWNRPDATEETLREGWLHTGDVAVMDADGFVYIQDRIKDMIISGGENVYPAEVENVLMAHPKIKEAAVIGKTSAKWGESPFAIVVRADESLSEAEIHDHCRSRLAGYKQPKGIAFIDVIPRNPSGKILKRVLREQFPEAAPV